MKIALHTSSNQTSCVTARRALRIAIAVLLVSPLTTWAQTPGVDDSKAPDPHQSHAATKSGDASKTADSDHQPSAADPKKARSKAKDPMQGMDHSKMEGMDHSKMEGMNHSKMEGMDHSKMQAMDPSKMEGMDHFKMQGMDMGSMNMQGGSAPPDARDPDYSDGVSAGAMAGMGGMHGHSLLGSVIVDRLEQFHGDDANGQGIDAQAWYGSDLNKLWFKLDGERSDGRLGATRSELLWNRAFPTYWGWQAGARHDFGEGPGRTWAAFGFQGLAPYWFDVQATAYVGEAGRTALRIETEYDVLLTQRLILQPDVELNLYGKNDAARGIGAGLSDIDVGLRLRYEITRKFAPYVGVVWSRKFGKTADYARADFGQVEDTQLVAGVRLWF